MPTLEQILNSVLQDRVQVEAVAYDASAGIIDVKVALPLLPDDERTQLEDWVDAQLVRAEVALGHDVVIQRVR